MALIIGTILAIVFLDWPWRLLIIIPLAVIEVLEILLWLTLRRKRALTGADAMVGTKGRTLSDCKPIGQVQARGTIWKANCPEGAEAGDEVEIVAMNGLQLDVRRVSHDFTPS